MLSDEDYVEPTKQVLKDCFGIEEEEVDTLIEESPDSRYSVLKKGIDYNTAKEFEAIDEDDENYPDVKGIWLAVPLAEVLTLLALIPIIRLRVMLLDLQ